MSAEPALSGLLDLAVRAVHLGARWLRERGGSAPTVRYAPDSTEPISEIDAGCENLVVDYLTSARPHDGILSEEGTRRGSATGLRWVLDPLDGTVNHLYGIPHFAVSLACERASGDGWRQVAAVVHDVHRAETFTAARGAGAYRDGVGITVNSGVRLARAVLGTEFSYTAIGRTRQSAVVAEVLRHAGDLRSSGSSALDLCWVAAGRLDGFFEDELSRWDWAAGALIVEEAGGVVSALGTGVIAADPGLHRELRELVAPSDTSADRRTATDSA
ncbi:inositol monophosphatase family protein [Nocardia takedensis]